MIDEKKYKEFPTPGGVGQSPKEDKDWMGIPPPTGIKVDKPNAWAVIKTIF